MSDHEEVNQNQSSCSSSECIATYNIISIQVCNVRIARLSKICRVKPQWLLEAKIGAYKLYDKSFLTLVLKSGWVSDDVS